MATTTLSVNVKQVLGTAFMEALTGNLTDETIAAVDNIHKEEVPAILVDALHAIQTMSTHSTVRESASLNVLGEFSAAADEQLKERLNS